MLLSIGDKTNVYSKGINFDHCQVTGETPKALKFELDDSLGSYLHEYHISFWLPKSVVYKNLSNDIFGNTISLPFWFELSYNKTIVS